MPDKLTLAIVTDIHHGAQKLTKMGEDALPLLRAFATFVDDSRPDLVVDLGDRISDVDAAEDRRLMADVGRIMASLPVPRVHLLGNHDVAHLGVADNESALGQSMHHGSRDVNGWHLVFWQPDTRLGLPHGFTQPSDDLRWLEADLASTHLPAVVFSHVPLDDASMAGNYWFQNNPAYATFPDARAIRSVLQRAGNVVLCVAGHVHWNNFTVIDGTTFLTVQSLTESFTTGGRAAGAWATLELDTELRWRTHGHDSIEVRRPLGGHNERWTQPLPPFAELRAARLAGRGLDGIRGLILDMDGVLYRGGAALPGAAAAVTALRDAGLAIVTVTNNARMSADQYAAKLADMGIAIEAGRIITAGDALVRLLTAGGARPRVHIAASPALRAQVLAAGAVESDRPDFVVAGIDLDMPIAALSRAAEHLVAGAELVASNADRMLPTAHGVAAEAGAVVGFLERASGKVARIAGKPDPGIFEMALERLGLPGHAVLVVGDNPETDIRGAMAAGLRSALLDAGTPLAGEQAPAAVPRFADLAAVAAAVLQALP